MSDVSELLKRMRSPMRSYAGTADLFNEAADALETLAGENEKLRKLSGKDASEFMQGLVDECSWEITKRKAAESRLAKLEPVAEAARVLTKSEGSNMWDAETWNAWDTIRQALATLEGAHD